jgi:hypothetical protein
MCSPDYKPPEPVEDENLESEKEVDSSKSASFREELVNQVEDNYVQANLEVEEVEIKPASF